MDNSAYSSRVNGPGVKPIRPGPAGGSILLVGNYRPTIPLAREFRARGYRVIAGLTDAPERGYASSRHVSELWSHPDPEVDPRAFLEALNAFVATRPEIVAVIPVAEDIVTLLNAHRDRLRRSSNYAMMAPDLIDLCLDKGRMLALAETVGVPQAPFRIVDRHEELATACGGIGFPVAIRPLHSHRKFGSRKTLLCRDHDELTALLPAWPGGHDRLIVQARVVGRRHNVYFAARDGDVFRLLETVADRTDHWDGTGLAVAGRIIEPSPALRWATEALLRAMNYTGIGCAQFLVDPETGQSSFLEINPRIAGNHAIPAAAGLDLGPALLALTRGEPCGPVRIARAGRRYVWSYGDFGGLARDLAARRIGLGAALRWGMAAARDAVRADMHLTWSWHDPLPALDAVVGKLFGLARKPAGPGKRPSVSRRPAAGGAR